MRSSEVSKLAAGMSQVFGALLKTFFDPNGHNAKLWGIALEFPDGRARTIFVDMGVFIQDGAAHKYMWCSKGASGTNFCSLCRNAVTVSSGLAEPRHNPSGYLKTDDPNINNFDVHTDESIYLLVQMLALKSYVVDKPHMDELEQAYGWKHEPYNMLLDGHALTNYACMLKSYIIIQHSYFAPHEYMYVDFIKCVWPLWEYL